jgi:hypothetical protein
MTSIRNTLAVLFLGVASSAYCQENVAVAFTGFYNSETPEFRPTYIDYSAMVSYNKVHKLLEGTFDEAVHVAPLGYVDNFLADVNSDESTHIREIFSVALNYANQYLRSRATDCEQCSELQFISIPGWGENDKVYLIMGLEIATPSGGLRSGLTVVAFDGLGEFQGIRTTPYNFTNYNSDAMFSDCEKLIASL